MAAGSGDGDGVELQLAEVIDQLESGSSGARTAALYPGRQAVPPRLGEAGRDHRETSGRAQIEGIVH